EGGLLGDSARAGRLARELAAPRGVLRSVAWSPDGARLLVTAFYDASAHLVRADDGRELGRFPVEREGAGVAFAPDGKQVAVGSDLGSVALYPIDADTPSRLLPATSGPASVLLFAGGRLLVGGNDGVLRVFDPESGALLSEGPPGTGITRLAAAPPLAHRRHGRLVERREAGGADHAHIRRTPVGRDQDLEEDDALLPEPARHQRVRRERVRAVGDARPAAAVAPAPVAAAT